MQAFRYSLLLIAFGAVFVSAQCRTSHALSFNHQVSEQKPNDYKVYKIDSLNNLYLIYAIRRDSVFKIVSLKQKGSANCTKLKVNDTYSLTLHSRFKGKYAIKSQNSNFNILYNYYGTFVPLEKELGIRDLFTADKLKGICLDQ